MTDFELQSDIKYYKADDCTAYIQSGKGRHGWVSGFTFAVNQKIGDYVYKSILDSKLSL